jgi:hypothetical protein
MDFQFIAIWCAILIAVTAINAYRFVVRYPLPYWLGAVVFGAAGLLAASNHHGPAANGWGAVAFAGWLTTGIALYGIPPRKPIRRVRTAR